MEQPHGGNTLEFYKKYGYKPVDFSANINPLGMPQSIKNAIIESLNCFEPYPDIHSIDLKEEISKVEGIDKRNIICGNGAACLIFRFCLALKPKKAILLAPTFSEYEKALKTVECDISYHNLKSENDFILQDDILESLNNDIDVVFLCQPNNPTGQCADKELLIKILKKCSENNIFLFCDECFLDFTHNFEQYSLKEFLNTHKNLFILKSFTKLYAMAGVRLGYGLCSDEKFLKKIDESGQAWCVSSVAQVAGIAALKDKEYVKNSLEFIKREKQFLIEELKKSGIKIIGHKANYIFFFCKDYELYFLLHKKGILIRQCENYKNIEKGYFRIAVRTHKENEQLITAIKSIREERGEIWENQ